MQKEFVGFLQIKDCFINILTESAQHLECVNSILRDGFDFDAIWAAALETMLPLLETDEKKEMKRMGLYDRHRNLEITCTLRIISQDGGGNMTFEREGRSFTVNYKELGRYEIEGRPLKYRPGVDGLLKFHQPNDDIGVHVDAVLIPYNLSLIHI